MRRRTLTLVMAAGAATAVLWTAGAAGADEAPFHPPVPILDAAGEPVAVSGEPVSPTRTCGACHDAEFIDGHAGHADAGASLLGTPGIHEWDLGPGWFGAWDPVTGRGTIGDPADTSEIATWLATMGARHAGGGPAVGTEFDCFICHLGTPDLDARNAMLAAGRPQDAPTATLAATGAVAFADGRWSWVATAFDPDGSISGLVPQEPTNAACGACHGVSVTGPEVAAIGPLDALADRMTVLTGELIAGDRMLESGANLEGKADLSRPWDVHAERVVTCVDCHHAANNPSLFREDAATRPDHLLVDSRRVDAGVYLERPDHRLVTEECTTCHDAGVGHEWLPYQARHFEALACETCHIPKAYAPALAVTDHTVVGTDGQPRREWRGVDGDPASAASLIRGYTPTILSDEDGQLAPYNMVATWFWVTGGRPVTDSEMAAALTSGAGHLPEMVAAFDADGDGSISTAEGVITTDDQELAIRNLLAAAGIPNAVISSEVRAYPLHHDVATGEWATSECRTCHGSDSILDAPLALTASAPGGILPQPVGIARAAGAVAHAGDTISFDPATGTGDLYVFGTDRVGLVDLVGVLTILAVVAAVVVHSSFRWWTAKKRPTARRAVEPVYMYSVYERLWHWLQTLAIGTLLATGLVIHAPDLLSFANFRWMVAVHNVVAAVLLVNAALAVFYHVVSGEIRQFLPRPRGFFDRAIAQSVYYIRGIFRGDAHPFEKDPRHKLNPLQQATYFVILNVLLPLQIITGIIIWGAQRWPDLAAGIGGLTVVAPVHALVAWFFAAFVILHVYLTTTAHRPLSGIKAMITGWDDVETRQAEEGSSA